MDLVKPPSYRYYLHFWLHLQGRYSGKVQVFTKIFFLIEGVLVFLLKDLTLILTLEQNLLFAGRYFNMRKQSIQNRKEKLIKQFELENVMHLPLNLLSIGYKQRFLLARTLA